MNSCILMAEVVQEPQLRYTQDNQTAIAEMLVQFEGSRDDDPPATMKVVGWGNLAQDIQQTYRAGDRVIIEGRLTMTSFDRPEGFKEKRAELTVQRIHKLDGSGTVSTSTAAPANTASVTPAAASAPAVSKAPAPRATKAPDAAPSAKPPAYSAPVSEAADYDDIPF